MLLLPDEFRRGCSPRSMGFELPSLMGQDRAADKLGHLRRYGHTHFEGTFSWSSLLCERGSLADRPGNGVKYQPNPLGSPGLKGFYLDQSLYSIPFLLRNGWVH